MSRSVKKRYHFHEAVCQEIQIVLAGLTVSNGSAKADTASHLLNVLIIAHPFIHKTQISEVVVDLKSVPQTLRDHGQGYVATCFEEYLQKCEKEVRDFTLQTNHLLSVV